MARKKADPEELQRLASHFRSMGAQNPESWARSQLEEGIPQFARLVFLREAWGAVIGDGDTRWIKRFTDEAERRPRDPGAGIGPALKRILASGADSGDLAEVVRVMQWHVLQAIADQLDDPGVVVYPSDNTPRVKWTLFEVNDDGEPLHPIGALHESLLDTEPTGREMRPKGVTRAG
jgi:hypothetical protein